MGEGGGTGLKKLVNKDKKKMMKTKPNKLPVSEV